MNTSDNRPDPTAPRGFRRVAPALTLFLVAPFVAEFLLGDFAIDALWLLLVVGPLYGGGALVVRETARRLGRGWPTILLLALAYGLLEEGIVIQTLFNPNYLGLHLLRQAWIPAFGIGGWWTVFVLTLHTVWSISVPIAIVEGLYAERRNRPWLGKLGFGVSAFLLVVGGVLIRGGTRKQDPFAASAGQLLGVWIAIALVVALALRLRPGPARRTGAVPVPWLTCVAAFVWGLLFMYVNRALQGWSLAGAQLALDAAGVVLLLAYARRTAWTPVHCVAAAGGALLSYACNGFSQVPVVGSKGTVDLVGNALFAALALTLLVLALKKERKRAAAAYCEGSARGATPA